MIWARLRKSRAVTSNGTRKVVPVTKNGSVTHGSTFEIIVQQIENQSLPYVSVWCLSCNDRIAEKMGFESLSGIMGEHWDKHLNPDGPQLKAETFG